LQPLDVTVGPTRKERRIGTIRFNPNVPQSQRLDERVARRGAGAA
jgi:hypothetical protein